MKKKSIWILTIALTIFTLAVTGLSTVSFASDFIMDIRAPEEGKNWNFNIWGGGVKTTFSDNGYSTILKVGENTVSVIKGTGTIEDVVCNTELSYVDGGENVKITYNITNNSSDVKTIGVATHADVMINNNDHAPIDNIEGDLGVTMTDGTYTFNFVGRENTHVTNVDTYWFGTYNKRQENMWNDSREYQGENTDSGIAYSWKDRTINPGQTLTFSALIGMNVPPTVAVSSSLKDLYYPNEIVYISGTVNDKNIGDIVSIKCSFDGGNEIEVGNGYNPNNVPINYDVQYQLPANIVQKEEHYIEIWGVDNHNNKGTSVKLKITVDDAPPVGTHTISPTWSKDNVTISVTAKDTKSGVKQITLPNGTVVNDKNANYTVSENGNYTFILADNAGNSGEYVVNVNNIDRTAPTVSVNPEMSGWKKYVNVELEFSDLESGLKNYQYCITDNPRLIGVNSDKWSAVINKQTDNIEINEEGTKYLHIKATDNVDNVSNEMIFGPYRIDNTPPEISIDYNTEKNVGFVDINIEATDNLSGIKSFEIRNMNSDVSEPIINGTWRFTKNGTYRVVAIDEADNTATVNFVVKNVYYECEAGLDHEPYLSDLDECPVCKTYKGLAVTEETHIYDKHEHQVKYNNPLNAKIVEYYNGSKGKPEKVGSYNYELKVVYEGDEKETGVKQGEYKTGITGTYTITPKEITITDIAAQDKTYNGNTKIALSGGRLEGVCTGDEVRFEMAYFGEAESKNVGNWKIAIDEITLEGKDAGNYTLKQPEYGGITANITQRGLSLELEGKNKKYDGNSTVDIIKKKEIGFIEGDNIRIHIPEQGVSESEKVGTWDVTISRIEIDGEDAGNYKLIQPEKGDIKVVISKEDGKLVIGCDSKLYDREEVEPYVVEKNSTSEVEYKYYKAGTNEQVEKPYDVGEYEVEGYIKTDGNYTETTSDRVSFEIKNPKEPILQVKTGIIEINGETLKGQETKKEDNAEKITEEKERKENTKVEYQDEVVMEVVVDNKGEGSGYAGKVKVKLPEGVELVKDNKTNEENGWQEVKDGIIETTKLSIQNNINNEIYANTKDITNEEGIETQKKEKKEIKTQETEENKTKEETGNNKTLKLVLKVTNTEKEEKELVLETEVEQQNKRGDVIPYTEETKAYGKTEEKMNLNYIDLEVEKRIIEIIEKDTKTGKQRKYDIYQKPNEIVKLELTSKKIGHTELIVKYEIGITNKGNKEGKIDKITDILPQGITFEKADNPDWTIDNNGNVVNDKLKEEKISPNETKKVELKLRWKVTENNLAARMNYAVVESEGELDQKLIQEEKMKLEKTNNYDSSEMLLSVQTGRTIALWITLAAISTGLLISGIVLIKEYVVKDV